MAWNEARGPSNASSYYTDEFNVRWLIEAVRDQVAQREVEATGD